MRLEINGDIVEMSFSMIEIALFIFGVYLITFFGVLTATLAARGIT
jgi:hypothetical protein